MYVSSKPYLIDALAISPSLSSAGLLPYPFRRFSYDALAVEAHKTHNVGTLYRLVSTLATLRDPVETNLVKHQHGDVEIFEGLIQSGTPT